MYILDTVWKQREYDQAWMKLGKIFDHDNTYRYHDENNKQVKFIPIMWVIMDVRDTKPKTEGTN